MQPVNTVQSNIHELNPVSKERAEALLQTPQELESVIPGSIWATLSGDQRVELLRQHGLLEKYLPATPAEVVPVQPMPEAAQEVLSQQVNHDEATVGAQIEITQPESISVQPEQIQEAAPEIQNENRVEVTPETQVEAESTEVDKSILQKDHQAVAQADAVTTERKTPIYNGYQPSESLIQNAEHVAENGSVTDAATWTATLLQKFWIMLTGK